VTQYNKLVRDNVPGTLRASGHKVATRTLQPTEMMKALRAKVDEELAEYDAAPDDQRAAEELADLLEVLMAIARRRGFTEAAIQQLREAKSAQRGTFERALFLISAE
jgi:predicted house-cleaning noncanonical NTP pyrophosphatase (MazG superfamily)